jgi:hypothetical protein
MKGKRVHDFARRGHPAEGASKIDRPLETVNLVDTLTKLVERPDDPTVEARRHAVDSFLREYVFRGLNDLKPTYDSALIPHFRAADFLRVIARCNLLGVHINGVEIFSPRGQLVEVEIGELDSNDWCVSLVRKYSRGKRSFCATYSVKVLSQHLAAMSHGLHQWGVVPVPGIFPSAEGSPRSYALIGYSNPDPSWLINALCFVAPLIALGDGRTEEPDLIVALSPKLIDPITMGLYFEDDELKYDFLEDWDRVWSPIKRRLWPHYGNGQTSTINLVTQHQSISPASEHDYRGEFLSYLTNIAESKGLIETSVDGSAWSRFRES